MGERGARGSDCSPFCDHSRQSLNHLAHLIWDVYQRKITLDQESFKALASDTRIEILKRLDVSQMTVTDLANDLSVNKSAVYKHLSRLLDAGLVKKLEDNRKWVYYRLSMKGMHLLHPERVQIALMLSAAVMAVTLAISQVLTFIMGSDILRKVSNPDDIYTDPVYVSETVHNPWLLVAGVALIVVGSVLFYFAYRLHLGAKARSAI